MGTHLKCLNEALQMSTHNICFCREKKEKNMYLDISYLEIRIFGADDSGNIQKMCIFLTCPCGTSLDGDCNHIFI